MATGYRGTVTFTSSDSQAGLPANYSFGAGDDGTHTFSVTLKTAGTQSIYGDRHGHFDHHRHPVGDRRQAGGAQSLAITGFPTSVTAGAAITSRHRLRPVRQRRHRLHGHGAFHEQRLEAVLPATTRSRRAMPDSFVQRNAQTAGPSRSRDRHRHVKHQGQRLDNREHQLGLCHLPEDGHHDPRQLDQRLRQSGLRSPQRRCQHPVVRQCHSCRSDTLHLDDHFVRHAAPSRLRAATTAWPLHGIRPRASRSHSISMTGKRTTSLSTRSIGPTTDAPSRSRSRARPPARSWIRSRISNFSRRRLSPVEDHRRRDHHRHPPHKRSQRGHQRVILRPGHGVRERRQFHREEREDLAAESGRPVNLR